MKLPKGFNQKLVAPSLSILFAILSGAGMIAFVNLVPQVDTKFFFSSDDPQLQATQRIEEVFSAYPQIILSASGNIKEKPYLLKLAELTSDLEEMDSLSGVKSLGAGPKSVEGAIKSPLWNRLLIGIDKKSSNLILNVKPRLGQDGTKKLATKLKKLQQKYESEEFSLAISGVPFVVSEIQDSLFKELKLFSSIAFCLFSLLILLIFRSGWILFGSIVACASATFLNFMILEILRIEAGVLMANLWSIVFVLTLSHIVYLTANWENSSQDPTGASVDAAINQTKKASFWAMVTTLLGFLTLLFVSARPLRHFGMSGAIGSLVSIAAAYVIFTSFLTLAKPRSKMNSGPASRFSSFLKKPQYWSIGLVILLMVTFLPGLKLINTDPPLFSYFSSKSRLHKDLIAIDSGGGSSPLEIIVRDDNNLKLNTQSAYKKMWELQLDLEEHPSVGTVISLPVLMGQAVKMPFSKYFSWEMKLSLMDTNLFEKIGRQFVTPDREMARFMIRMREGARVGSREKVVEQIENIVKNRGFVPEMTGGLYHLQGQLSDLLSVSLIKGIGGLIALFCIIGFIVSRSLYVTAVMITCLSVIPLILYGFIGHLGIPLDIIAAPGANIAIAMGIDDMIHLTYRARGYQSNGKNLREAWNTAIDAVWRPVLASTLIVVLGFAVFVLSDFPPTQRLGLVVAGGTLLSKVMAMFVFPTLARLRA